ncbi:hypothetical protein AJ78_07677 [Emergomyces pasteurianus Ep9510]|uniref:Uncharacterized protein n=1 Tax=Emergomyces pasteurianus Ep9510 TaxID=1447872 RepID=A0A1J9Q5Q1_9EURO|nr:hypothetical protein AJ78_07677 [Emergomyces pasteurianus Ep9510]
MLKFQDMSGYPTSDTSIRRIGVSEFCIINKRQFTRKRGVQEWTEVFLSGELPEGTEQLSLRVALVQQSQAPDEPLHWSLFVAREGQAGWVYQVKGDAEFMQYQSSHIQIDITVSATFLNMYNLVTVTEQQATVVKAIAEQEPPPRVPSRQAVMKNCQGWTVRVIAKLVERGIVENSKLNMARSMVQQI